MTGNKIIAEDMNLIISQSLNWQKFSGKNILISGANGFLPAYMVETILALLEKGIIQHTKVLALVRNLDKAKNRFADYLDNEHLQFVVQDVCEPVTITEKLDFILHAASQASPKYYGTDPVGTLSANTLGTANMLQLAQKHQVESFLYFSSSEVYGKISEEIVHIKEDDFGIVDPTNVRSCYAESKRLGETMCVSWHHQFQVQVKIVRPFHTYGPGLALDDGRVYADFISNIVHNQDIVMNSDGLAQRAFCYLTDASLAFFTVLLEGENGQSYNVGNPNCEVSIVQLAEKLTALFPEKNLKTIRKEVSGSGYLKSQINRNSPDISKLKKLGWEPKVSIEEGFSRTIKSYK